MSSEHKITDKHRAMFSELRRTGRDPISVLCGILANENATTQQRREAARALQPYYHAQLAKMGALIEKFGK
jgi:hypothetical protein